MMILVGRSIELLSRNHFNTNKAIHLLNSLAKVSHIGTDFFDYSNLQMVKSRSSKSVGLSHSKELTPVSAFKSEKSLSSIKSIGQGIKMKIIPVKALQDNYMYLLIDEYTRQAAAVDPVNASAMAHLVADEGVDLKAILTTHHHYDHSHGNNDMLSMFPDIIVYGGDKRIEALNKSVNHGDTFNLGNLTIECLSTPCHTTGHICYYVTSDPDSLISGPVSNTERAVFTGDTLFIAGCGRFFEGSPEQMNHALNVVLGGLPPETRVYCGHEYTVDNLLFALSVEPQNADMKSKLIWARKKQSSQEPTVPSTIGEEKKINPFMRLKGQQVKKYTGENEEHEVIAVLRERKNKFRPSVSPKV